MKYYIAAMQQQASSEQILTQRNDCLNVCRLIVMRSKHTEKLTCFYMTLLSYAAIHKNETLMQLLMDKGGNNNYSL